MLAGSAKVFVVLLSIALFLGLGVPLYIAPKAFYNGLPVVTELVPLSILIASALSVAGLLYLKFERKAEEKESASAAK